MSYLGTEKLVGCVVPRQAGGYIIAEETRFAFVDWVKRSVTPVTNVDDREKPNTRFNDGKVDPAGRFFAGTVWEKSCSRAYFHSADVKYKKIESIILWQL